MLSSLEDALELDRGRRTEVEGGGLGGTGERCASMKSEREFSGTGRTDGAAPGH